MDRSLTLLNAQLQFLETQLTLVHIPLSLYPLFIQPILQLLTLSESADQDDHVIPRKPWAYAVPFTNISVTSMECSIACPRYLWHDLFVPVMEKLDKSSRQQISISQDDFMIIQVGGEGIEAGQRVLDVTAPLALAGISIFFITSYYCDFILIPHRSRLTVIHALEGQGFAFEHQSNGHFSSNMTNVSSPLLGHNRNTSSSSSFDVQSPSTPPPQTIAGWQTKTFQTLKRNNIIPHVDDTMELILCAGYKGDRATQDKVQYGIISCLINTPRFLSITLSETESVSLTLEKGLLSRFPKEGKDVLLMTEQTHIPIMLDLSGLPEESAGIICGVAGRLIDRMGNNIREGFNMSYLSTARAGNVIVQDDEVEAALEALKEMDEVCNGEMKHA